MKRQTFSAKQPLLSDVDRRLLERRIRSIAGRALRPARTAAASRKAHAAAAAGAAVQIGGPH